MYQFFDRSIQLFSLTRLYSNSFLKDSDFLSESVCLTLSRDNFEHTEPNIRKNWEITQQKNLLCLTRYKNWEFLLLVLSQSVSLLSQTLPMCPRELNQNKSKHKQKPENVIKDNWCKFFSFFIFFFWPACKWSTSQRKKYKKTTRFSSVISDLPVAHSCATAF